MHGRGNTGHYNELSPSGFLRDDDESAKSEAGTGNDAAGGGRASDTRQSNSIPMTNLGLNAPTMRSRVTVVCAECKKQKLRCDRRIPCESCVKRNTVARCIYTPAAIEKVDMTSINNRLRVVEGSLNALGVPTQGHVHSFPALAALPQLSMHHSGTIPFLNAGPSGFSPSGGAQPSASTIKPSSHQDGQAPELADGPGQNVPLPRMLAMTNDARCASAVAPLDGVTALWVREVTGESGQLSPYCTSTVERDSRDSVTHPHSSSTRISYNKPTKVDLRPIDRECLGPAPALGCGASHDLDAHQLLSLHAGLGIPSSSDEAERRAPEAEFARRSSRIPLPTDPLLDIYTPLGTQLLAQFPSRRRRREMLLRLGTAFLVEGISCVPFGAFCDSIESVFISLRDERPESSSHSPVPAFSAIAEAAAGLAVGALIWASEPSAGGKTHGEALRRIICRMIEPFLAVPTVRTSSSPANGESASSSTSQDNADIRRDEDELERPNPEEAFALYRLAQLALSIHTSRHGHAALDIALIHARILSAHYLLVAQSISAEFPDALLPSELPPLVGALIWEARGMGLGIDPDEFDPVGEARHASVARVAGTVSRLGIPVKREDGGESSDWLPQGTGMSLFVKEVRRRMWWWIVWLDFAVSDAYGYDTVILPGEHTTHLPANVDDTCFRPDSEVLPPPDDTTLEKNTSFLIAKFRLLEIAKNAPVRVFRSGLVPKATEDAETSTRTAAQKLADDTMQWLEELPERFKLDADPSAGTFSQSPMTSLRPPSEAEEERNAGKAMLISQQCDVAFHGYHCLIRLFTPMLPLSSSPKPHRYANFPWHNDKVMHADRQLAGLKVIQPALAIVHAAEVQMTHALDLPYAIYHMYLFPRRLFDAAAVLAYTAIQQPLYTSPIVIEAVHTARDILSRILKGNRGGSDDSESQETEAERVIELLLKRAEKAKTQSAPIMVGVKRKHEEIETEIEPLGSPFRFPFMGTGIANVYKAPISMSASRRGSIDRGDVPDKFQPSVPTSTRASSSSRKSTNKVPESRDRNVPAISIRHRVKDGRAKVDVTRTGLTPADPGFRSPSLMLPPQPASQPVQRTFSSGPPVSPSPSAFASEAMSTSPISPATHYDLNQGMRPQASAMSDGFLSADAGSGGPMPFQDPRVLSVTHQYSGPSFGVPLHLQHRHNRELPLSTDSPRLTTEGIQYNVGPTHPSPAVQRVQDSERIDGTRSWHPASFGDQGHSDVNLPHTIETYPPSQHTQQSQSTTWTGGENIHSTALAQPWNMALFTNWNHDAQ